MKLRRPDKAATFRIIFLIPDCNFLSRCKSCNCLGSSKNQSVVTVWIIASIHWIRSCEVVIIIIFIVYNMRIRSLWNQRSICIRIFGSNDSVYGIGSRTIGIDLSNIVLIPGNTICLLCSVRVGCGCFCARFFWEKLSGEFSALIHCHIFCSNLKFCIVWILEFLSNFVILCFGKSLFFCPYGILWCILNFLEFIGRNSLILKGLEICCCYKCYGVCSLYEDLIYLICTVVYTSHFLNLIYLWKGCTSLIFIGNKILGII